MPRDITSCPRQGTNQKGTGATSSFATRTRDQWDILSPHNPLDSPNPLGGSGELIIRWSLVRVQPAPQTESAGYAALSVVRDYVESERNMMS